MLGDLSRDNRLFLVTGVSAPRICIEFRLRPKHDETSTL